MRTPRVAIVTGAGSVSMFAEPQPVEAHHRGTWYSGELLGWRFEEAGRCLVRVRCVVDGLRRSAWVDLADVRLPERAARPASPAAPPASPPPASPPVASPPEVPAAPPGRHAADRHAAPSVAPSIAPPPRRVRAEPTAAPPVQWASIRRHEQAAPVWPGPGVRGRHHLLDDDTQPHALLIDRDRRPAVPRPVPSSRAPRQSRRVDAG